VTRGEPEVFPGEAELAIKSYLQKSDPVNEWIPACRTRNDVLQW